MKKDLLNHNLVDIFEELAEITDTILENKSPPQYGNDIEVLNSVNFFSQKPIFKDWDTFIKFSRTLSVTSQPSGPDLILTNPACAINCKTISATSLNTIAELL